MKNLTRLSLSVLSLAAVSGALLSTALIRSGHAVIRGEDGRIEAYEVQDSLLKSMSDANVAIFNKSELSISRKQVKLKKGETFGEANNLCTDQRFLQQPRNSFCSGTLIAPNLILTAGHCVSPSGNQEPSWCRKNVKFVFGYEMASADSVNAIDKSETYDCKNIVAFKMDLQGENYVDYALVQLDRVVTNHVPAAVDRSLLPIDLKTPLTLIGYPDGLPKKVALGGSVKTSDPKQSYYTADLDSIGGNSGSPVFNAKTGEVVGILGGKVIITAKRVKPGQTGNFGTMIMPKRSSGDIDFILSDKPGAECLVENRKPDAETLGDLVTRISLVAPSIPQK
ncbi:MAG: trypsin-like peptidase domain-containing protein [Methylotenera sp.]|nr:trypsin-like peptidase domain-containing protein [Oligoflexia bacterium]